MLKPVGDFVSTKLTIRRLTAPAAPRGGAAAAAQPWGLDLFSPSATAPAPASAAVASGAPAPSGVVAPGETIYKLAERMLGDAGRWRELYEANRDQLSSPYVIFPGTTLRLPSAQRAGASSGGASLGSTTLRRMADEVGAKHGVDPKLIMAVVQAESGGDAGARSPVGAQGLMQLMPGTARDLGVNNPYDARQNMEGGAKYLKQLLEMFGGDLKLAIAAYNAGPGNVRKYDGVPPFAETRRYVPKVLGFYEDQGGLA